MKEEIRRTETLLSEEMIRARVGELAKEISADYEEGAEVLLVGVLKGSYIFMGDLQRELWRNGRDFKVDFMGLSSYDGEKESSRNPRITADLTVDVYGKRVLIVEDIVDTGLSLDFLERFLLERGVVEVKKVAFLSKPSRREVEVKVEYVGFEVDGWVEGYGLDTDQSGRGNPELIVVKN